MFGPILFSHKILLSENVTLETSASDRVIIWVSTVSEIKITILGMHCYVLCLEMQQLFSFGIVVVKMID